MFSQAERQFNREIRDCLSRSFDVFLPHESGVLMPNLLHSGFSPSAAIQKVLGEIWSRFGNVTPCLLCSTDAAWMKEPHSNSDSVTHWGRCALDCKRT